MKKIFALLSAVAIVGSMQAQTILITDADLDQANPMDCNMPPFDNTAPNFQDPGAGADYGPNQDETFTFCPDPLTGSKASITFAINAGYTFDVHASDTIYVYDGPSTASPLLGKHNSDTDPNGFTYSASFTNNPTGCLTVRFVSDGADEGSGWDANLSCGDAIQPFDIHISSFINGTGSNAVMPLDTGYSDLCFGDSLLLVANGAYPFDSTATGTGYEQNDDNVVFEWEFTNGDTATGDSVWFVPPARSGYLVLLRATDIKNQTIVLQSRIRVSTIPNFSTTEAIPPAICLGDTSTLLGGVSLTDTLGVDPTTSAFEIGGSFAGLTYLPDGSGQNYTTSINIAGFDSGQVLQNTSDLRQLCLTLEHSHLGDLEMQLTCPNGTSINIFNAFTGNGLFPGGFGGGGTYLGDATDGSLQVPGVGWEYCFSTTQSTFGTLGTEFAAGNFVQSTIAPAGNSMNPNGVYQPEQDFVDLAGCPLNGTWTVTVRDNQGVDDGYIFEWGLFFDPVINPNTEEYTPIIVSDMWEPDPTLTNDGDTTATVVPDQLGDNPYRFIVTDDFGCEHDTIINVHVFEFPSLNPSIETCDTLVSQVGNSGPNGGVWSVVSTPGGTVNFIDVNDINTTIDVDLVGTYEFMFTDTVCGYDSTVTVIVQPLPAVTVPNLVCDLSTTLSGNFAANGGLWINTNGPGNVTFGDNTDPNTTITVDQPGTYTFNFTDNVCNETFLTSIVFADAPQITPSITICDTLIPQAGNVADVPGEWSVFSSPGGDIFFSDSSDINATIDVDTTGTFVFIYSDTVCNFDTTLTVTVVPGPFITAPAIVCGTSVALTGNFATNNQGLWLMTSGPGTPTYSDVTDPNTTISVTASGTYEFTFTDDACLISVPVTISFNNGPTLVNPPLVCGKLLTQGGNSTIGGGAWTFVSGPGSATFLDTFNVNSAIEIDVVGTYVFRYTDTVCNLSQDITVTYKSQPFATSISYTKCDGQSQLLNAQAGTSGSADATFTWSTGETTQFIEVEEGATYTVTLINECGTATGVHVVADMVCDVTVPNVFSPNGDGLNDRFVIVGLEFHPSADLVVFNRWGKKIYENFEYQNDWDGSNSISGAAAREGTYYYVLTLNDGNKVETGTVNIIGRE